LIVTHFQTIGEVDLGDYGRALVRVGRYAQGGQLAITLVDADTSKPIANLSTNLVVYNHSTAPDVAGIKVWSENAPIIEPLLASGLFKDTGERIMAEYVEIPIWRLSNPEHVPPMPPQRQRTR
jgi:hypothetical protein